MKLKRVLSVVCLGALLSALLTGCVTNKPVPLPEGMDEKTVVAAGEAVVELLLAEKYEEVAATFREDIRSQPGKEITADVVKELVEGQILPEESGIFDKIIDTYAEGVDGAAEPQGVAVIHAEYTKDKVGFGIAFDPDMNLIGLSIATDMM